MKRDEFIFVLGLTIGLVFQWGHTFFAVVIGYCIGRYAATSTPTDLINSINNNIDNLNINNIPVQQQQQLKTTNTKTKKKNSTQINDVGTAGNSVGTPVSTPSGSGSGSGGENDEIIILPENSSVVNKLHSYANGIITTFYQTKTQ